MRIGHGFDAHQFCDGNEITLGGVVIPHTHGIAAHSDGDVILHALCDALLGATALGDIGQFFPSSDERYAKMNSSEFVREVYSKVKEQAYCVGNVDITLIAEAPKLSPYREQMRNNIADLLDVELRAVSVKATTTDKLGFCGRKEGLAAHAVVLLHKK